MEKVSAKRYRRTMYLEVTRRYRLWKNNDDGVRFKRVKTRTKSNSRRKGKYCRCMQNK